METISKFARLRGTCVLMALVSLQAACTADSDSIDPIGAPDAGTRVGPIDGGLDLPTDRPRSLASPTVDRAPAQPTLDRTTPRRGGIHAEHGASGELPQAPAVAVDSDAGYVFVREGGTTKVIALANGQMVRRLDWGGPMVLDAQGRRLYIDSSAEPAALIIVDTRSLDQVGKIPLPPRDDSPSPDDPDARWGEPRVAPVLLPQRGTVLIFRAGKALEYDPTTGASGSLELSPLEETPHALRQALGSPDGRTLYVAKHAFDEPIYDVNTQLAAIDVESGRTLWNRPVFGKLTFLFASEAGLLTSSDWGRGDGSNLYVWNRDGLALRSEGWPTRIHSAFHDREAGQIILVIDQFIEQDLLAILDDTTLSLRYVTPAPTNAMLVASDSPHDRWLLDTGERAVVVDDAALLHLPETSESPQAAEEGSHGLVAVSPSWPDDDTIVRATVLPGAARCFDTWRARDLALSSDLGRTWRSIHSGLPTCHRQIDHAPVLAPGFGHDRRMYLGVAGLGIFRFSLSDPIWRPVNDGLRALGIGDFVLSPHFDIDPTMIAFSADRGLPIDAFATESEPQLATTWISRNAGDQWS